MNTFDDKTHCYKINGQPVPSVTSVLKEAGLIDCSWYTPEGTRRGTLVHQACELWDKGELDTCTLDPQLVPYLEAWKKFRHDSGMIPVIIEKQYYSEKHGFAGTIDRAFFDDRDKFVVLEIKSGPLPSWLPLQLAGYSILLNAFSGVGIQLRDNDKYSVKLIKTPELFKARRQFLEMLDKVKRQRRESNGTKTESDNGSQK